MRRYNEFSALWRAVIFQKAFYQDVAQNWRGIGLRYLFLLIVPTWLVVLIPATFGVHRFLLNDAPAALKDFPAITITKGVATSDAPQPYILKDDSGHPFFVFDTTGTVKTPSDAGAKLLMTGTELIQEDPPGTVQRRSLSEMPDMTIDQPWLLSWVRFLRNWMIPGGLILCGAFSIVWRLVFGLLYALIGRGFNAMFRGGIGFAGLLRLTLVSMTAPILLDTILWLCHMPFTCGIVWLALQAITLAYLLYGVKAAAQVLPRREVAFPEGPSTPNLPLRPPPPLPPEKPGSELFP